VFGLSYHFDKDGAVPRAPFRLDKNAQTVFNPGLGVGYDFRKDILQGGFSPVVLAGYFDNCANMPFFFAGGGVRYRRFLTQNVFLEANLLGVFGDGKDWEEKKFEAGALPYANIGIGAVTGQHLTTFSVAYIPKNSGNTITDGTDLLFMNLSFSF